jgi:hypothetical protein
MYSGTRYHMQLAGPVGWRVPGGQTSMFRVRSWHKAAVPAVRRFVRS